MKLFRKQLRLMIVSCYIVGDKPAGRITVYLPAGISGWMEGGIKFEIPR